MKRLERDKIVFGIIGCGAIANIHAKAIKSIEIAELRAVADVNIDSACNLAQRYQVEKFYGDYRELLKDDSIEIVNICTPSGLRAEIAIDCARAGKHIIAEKPIEVTLERIDKMIEECEKNDVALAGIFNNRYNKNYRIVYDMIKKGRFGNLILGDVYVKWYRDKEYYTRSSWRGTWRFDGGGALMNQSIHFIDLLQWYMGPVESIKAYTTQAVHKYIETEDLGVAIIRFKNGALGVIEGSTALYPGLHDRIEIHGENGSILIENSKILRWEFRDKDPIDEEIIRNKGLETFELGSSRDPMEIPYELHKREIEDIINSLREGKKPLIDGYEARKAVEIILAIYRASKTGEEVKLPL
ncbi:MAG: Gfo/Idh/MocA family oxidoreductase [bacterium]|nr:Gfo/Idh/MocA family oxidoreductase [bacterium]